MFKKLSVIKAEKSRIFNFSFDVRLLLYSTIKCARRNTFTEEEKKLVIKSLKKNKDYSDHY